MTVSLLCAVFAVTLVFAEYDYFAKGASPRYEYPELARILQDETEFDVKTRSGDSMVYPWEYYNYTVYNPYLKNTKGADLILSYDNLDYALLGAEKYSKIKLYSSSEVPGKGIDLKGIPSADIFAEADRGKITVTVKNKGRPWLCMASADNMEDAVRVGLRIYRGEELLADLRQDFVHNVYSGESVVFDFPFADGEYTVVAETVKEFVFRGGEAPYKLKKSGEVIELTETDFSKDETVWEFNPEEIPGASGLYKYYVIGNGAKFPGLSLSGDVLCIETFGEKPGLSVDVFADGKKLKLLEYKDNIYEYRLESTVETLMIKSETYKPCDDSFGFLTTESNFKPVDIFVRGMKKIFKIRLDHRDYGVDIKKIKVYKEELQ